MPISISSLIIWNIHYSCPILFYRVKHSSFLSLSRSTNCRKLKLHARPRTWHVKHLKLDIPERYLGHWFFSINKRYRLQRLIEPLVLVKYRELCLHCPILMRDITCLMWWNSLSISVSLSIYLSIFPIQIRKTGLLKD